MGIQNLGAKEFAKEERRAVASVGILFIEREFDSLNLVAELDGWAQLEVHALLNSRKGQQEEGLAVNVLQGREEEERAWQFSGALESRL